MLAHVWDDLSDGILLLDDGGVVTEANAPACRIFGLEAAAIIGRRAVDLPCAGELEGAKLMPRPDGALTPVSVMERELPGGGTAVILRDVTAELSFAELQRDLGSTLSHDIRTGLAGIMLGLDAVISIASSELGPSLQTFLTRSRAACDRVLWLVSDAHDAVRLPAGLAALSIEEVALGDAMGEGLTFVREDAADAAIELDVRVEPESVVLLADRDRLVRLIHNLVKVALDISPRRTRVSIAASPEPRLQSGGLAIAVSSAEGANAPASATRVFDTYRTEDPGAANKALSRACGFRFIRAAAAAHGWRLAAEVIDGTLWFVVGVPESSIVEW